MSEHEKREEDKTEEKIPSDGDVAMMSQEERDRWASEDTVVWEPDEDDTASEQKAEGGTPPVEEAEGETAPIEVPEELPEAQVQGSAYFIRERKKRQVLQEENEMLRRDSEEREVRLEALEDVIAELKGDEFDDDDDDDELDLTDPKQLREFIRTSRDDDDDEDDDTPALEVIPDEVTAVESGGQFFDSSGNVYDDLIDTNTSGKAYFRVRDTETGEERLIFDRKALVGFDEEQLARLGQDNYIAMWGTIDAPGPMTRWRDTAPEAEVLMLLNEPDPVIAVVNKYNDIVKGSQPTPPRPHTTPPTPAQTPPGPAGLGPGAQSEGTDPPQQRRFVEISDEEIRDMSQDERDRIVGGE